MWWALSDHPPDRHPNSQPGPDLEDDRAHEATRKNMDASPEHAVQQVTVAISTPKYDGDCTYDLGREIPGR